MLEFLLHTDKYLADLIVQYGPWIYALLFAIVFCETGLVVTPFLPGDSLLFAAGALAATTGQMSIPLLWVLLAFAAILGDAVNYSIGRRLGTRVFSEDARILKTAYLRRTEAFYEKHGNRTIILARFVPILRTFAPFVDVVGGLAWVTIFLGAGALFGQIEFVKKNFEVVTLGIVLVSVLPIVFEFVKEKRRPTADPK